MRVRIMENTPERLTQLARDWGIRPVQGQAMDVIYSAIAAAYRREVEAEERRVWHERALRRLRDGAA